MVILLPGGGGLDTKLCWTLATLWTIANQTPLSMGFSRQEYLSRLPFPSLGDLPDPGIEPGSPALQADSLPSYEGSSTFPGDSSIIRNALPTFSTGQLLLLFKVSAQVLLSLKKFPRSLGWAKLSLFVCEITKSFCDMIESY